MRTTNNFLVVPRIIFNTSIENYFFIVLRLFFAVSRIYFWFYNALRALQLKWTGSSLWLPWATILKTLQVEECFPRECQGETSSENWNDSLCRSWWGFLDRRFNRGDYEGTSRLVHNSNPYSEHDMSARLNCALPGLVLKSSSRTTHAGFRNEDAENASVPYMYLEVQKKLPILIQMGKH